MSLKNYRWRLKIGSAAYVVANPIWNDETAFLTEGQPNEMYFREQLRVTLRFLRGEFESINNAAFDTEFRIILDKDISGSWVSQWIGKFWYTDIEFDVDNRTCIVTPETFDLYDDLLTGLEKEFNLVALEPPTVSVKMLKQAVIQVYFPGASFVANFTNDGIFYETPCTPFNTTPAPGETGTTTNHDSLLADSGFGLGTGYTTPDDGLYNWARVVIPGSGITPDVSGVYYAQSYSAEGLPLITTNKATSYIRQDGVYAIVNDGLTAPGTTRQLIRRVSDDVDVYESPLQTSPWSPFGQPPHSSPNQLFASTTSASEVHAFLFMPYVRLLTTQTEIDGDATVELMDDDPIPHGSFTHALPLDTLNFVFSEGNSTDPTRWGKFDDDMLHFAGDYFAKPDDAETLMPVAGTTWTGASGWFYLDDDLRALQQEGSETIIIKDAYKLSDAIAALLAEIQPLVAHDETASYSQFLYAAGTNPIRGDQKWPIIIPKTNVIVGNYDHPDKKENLRLSEVLQLLRFYANCYWHISESKLIIEHEDYYHNGKSYTTETVGIDLTGTIEPKTGVEWAYRTNKFKFDKTNMPERIETNWMDKGSPQFDGYPIQMVSNYAQRGNIEQRQISKFTADIDFIHVASDQIGKDGFVFLECVENGVDADYEVPFVTFVVSADETYTMQNGYAALVYAHDAYHKYNLPTLDVELNNAEIEAETVKRSKVQTVTFASEEDIDPYELVTTNLGNGRVRSLKRPINSNTIEAVIMHNNE